MTHVYLLLNHLNLERDTLNQELPWKSSSNSFWQRNVSTSLFAQASVLRDMFIVKNNTSRLLFVCVYPHVRSDYSVDQSMEEVCSSNFPAPFQASQYPNGGVLKTREKRVRLSPGHAHFWRWKRNPYRTFVNRTAPCSGNAP